MLTRSIVLTALLLITTGCESLRSVQGDGEEFDATRKQLIGEMPLPPGTTIDNNKSLILGADHNWTGRVVAKAKGALSENFNWLREQYKANGWQTLSSVKAKHSILVMSRAERTVTIELVDSSFGDIEIILTVAPRSAKTEPPR